MTWLSSKGSQPDLGFNIDLKVEDNLSVQASVACLMAMAELKGTKARFGV